MFVTMFVRATKLLFEFLVVTPVSTTIGRCHMTFLPKARPPAEAAGHVWQSNQEENMLDMFFIVFIDPCPFCYSHHWISYFYSMIFVCSQ